MFTDRINAGTDVFIQQIALESNSSQVGKEFEPRGRRMAGICAFA